MGVTILTGAPHVKACGLNCRPPRVGVSLSQVGHPEFPLPARGRRLGDYELIEEIGAGGFSFVWLGRHRPSSSIVALKLPRVPEFIAYLRREALIASAIQDPQIVGIQGVHLDHDPPFLVMPYIPGSNLALPDAAPAPENIVTALRTFRRIVEVVARLHDAEIAHGDLKPGNIRFDPAGTCFLLDLGLATQQVKTRQTTTLRASVVGVDGRNIAGTLAYMAPEVMTGGAPQKAADVYALGVILHAMLCGRPPAFGVNPRELNPYLPPGTTDVLRQMLHPDPHKRFPTAAWLLPSIDGFIRAEERCLRRPRGHARRLVFRERMKTLARGIKVLLFTTLVILLFAFELPRLSAFASKLLKSDGVTLFVGGAAVYLSIMGTLLGITTINAWVMRIPEKTYKNRRGHPLWTFMMQ